jgi:AraC-like DNA-binding protein
LNKRDSYPGQVPESGSMGAVGGVGSPAMGRGVLRPELAAARFQLTRRPPSAGLAPFVEFYWILRWDLRGQPPHEQTILPHPNVNLAFEASGTSIYGVDRRLFTRSLSGSGRVFGVRFLAGCFRPFWRAPISELTDRVVPAVRIFGPEAEQTRRAIMRADTLAGASASTLAGASAGASADTSADTLADTLAGASADTLAGALADTLAGASADTLAGALAGADAVMTEQAEALLLSVRPERDSAAEQAAELVARITGDPALRRVDELAAASEMSVRSLQRLFADYVGVSPKWVMRRARLHEAAERADGGKVVDWAGLAADLGYADQAHLTHDFTATIGVPPTHYAAEPLRAEPLGAEPLGTEPLGTEPLGTEPLGTEPLGTEPAS